MVDDQPAADPPCRVFLRPARVPVDELEALELGYELFEALVRQNDDSGVSPSAPAPASSEGRVRRARSRHRPE